MGSNAKKFRKESEMKIEGMIILLIVIAVVISLVIFNFTAIIEIKKEISHNEQIIRTPVIITKILSEKEMWEHKNPAKFKIYNGVKLISNEDPYIIIGIDVLKRTGRVGALNVYVYERNYILSQQRNALFYPFIVQVAEENMIKYFKNY